MLERTTSGLGLHKHQQDWGTQKLAALALSHFGHLSISYEGESHAATVRSNGSPSMSLAAVYLRERGCSKGWYMVC